MELSEYLSVLRKHWFAIALVGLVGFGGAYAYSTSLPPAYRASTSSWVTVPSSADAGERVQGLDYVQSRIESYALLATTPFVLDPVIETLGLDTTAREFAGSLTVSSPLNSQFLEVSASAGDPARAAEVANAVSAELAEAVTALEGGADGLAGPVTLSVVAAASPPRFAYQPNTKLNAATGLALGLVIGVIGALARTVLDTRVRSVKDVRRVTDAAVVSSVRYDRRTVGDPVVMRSAPFGDKAEAYRRLRTNLRFVNLTGPSRSIMVTSAVPSEGKTTTAINLAIAMAEGSARILLVDADLRNPSVARYLGLEGAVGLTTVLIGEATPADVIQQWGDGLDVLPAGQIPPNPSELLDSPAMADLLAELAKTYEIVLIDSAPLVPVTDSAALSHFVDGTLLVVGCQTLHRSQLAEALMALETVGARLLGLVLNQVSSRELGQTYVYATEPKSGRRMWLRGLRRVGEPGRSAGRGHHVSEHRPVATDPVVPPGVGSDPSDQDAVPTPRPGGELDETGELLDGEVRAVLEDDLDTVVDESLLAPEDDAPSIAVREPHAPRR